MLIATGPGVVLSFTPTSSLLRQHARPAGRACIGGCKIGNTVVVKVVDDHAGGIAAGGQVSRGGEGPVAVAEDHADAVTQAPPTTMSSLASPLRSRVEMEVGALFR